jgi:hypothetical protein
MSAQAFVFIIPGHDNQVTLPVSPTALVSTVIATLCSLHGLDPTSVALFVDNARLPLDVPFCSCVALGKRVIVDEGIGSNEDEEEEDALEEDEEVDVPDPADASSRVQALQAVFADKYTPELLEHALRVAHWQPDRAFDILESRQVPNRPVACDYIQVDVQTAATGAGARYTAAEKAAIRVLYREFSLDIATILQCYEDCERREDHTRALLAQIAGEG